MRASLFLTSAVAMSAWAAPIFPKIDADASIPDNIRVLSEYFGLLASKVQEARAHGTAAICDLSHVSLPAAAAGLPAPSDGLFLEHIAIGRGTQNYTCNPATPEVAPKAAGALAHLFNASCLAAVTPDLATTLARAALHFDVAQSEANRHLVPSNLNPSGLHFFVDDTTPLFKLDVSPDLQLGELPCSKNSSLPAPPDAPKGLQGEAAVPWLKLVAKPGATGGLQEVYRVATVGGSAPATCAGLPEKFEVQYAAQ
ncbi:uncharacterized protein C8A04DRAFT_33700 [Dichotomopilus funicola]|uniref:Malate dehydrogenase n=1 Tax=Dichotomopilus funicola TaxID=1934379 RepID=A0AAN6VB62_9PEZI|nr:hypothetical protein C8A04DRAFT_33700 [Dichotomopilus funicola]